MTKIAHPFLRLQGFLLDTLIFLLPTSIYFYIWTQSVNIPQFLTYFFIYLAAVFFPLIILTGLINSVLTYYLGGTLGKLFSGMQLQSEEEKPLSFLYILFRQTIGMTFSGIFLGLGYLAMIPDPKRQCWHDQTVGSIVFYKYPIFFIGTIIMVTLMAANIYFFSGGVQNFQNNILLKTDLGYLARDFIQEQNDNSYKNKPASPGSQKESKVAELTSENYTELATQSVASQDYNQALEYAQTAVAINPRDPKIHQLLGEILQKLGEEEKAQVEFQKAGELRNSN